MQLERLIGGDRKAPEGDLAAIGDGELGSILFGVVEGDVLAGLEQAQFADALHGDAAGGEVGDAAIVKLEAYVGDVDFGGEDRDASGADLLEFAADEAEDDIEVVDHEVEHHVNIETAGAKHAHTMDFEKEGQGYSLFERDDDRVEAFEVSDLEDAAMLSGGGDEAAGCFERRGDGLFDEYVDAGLEQALTDRLVLGGRGGYDGGIDFARKLQHVAEPQTGRGDVGSGEAIGIGIDDGDEVGEWRLAANADMVFAELSGTDDGYADSGGGFGGQL